jgi:hypothetical protein
MRFLSVLFGFLATIEIASCTAPIDKLPFEKIVNDYYNVRALDFLNGTNNSRSFLSKTFFHPGTAKPSIYVIKRDIHIISLEKRTEMIDYDKEIEGEVYRITVGYSIVGKLVGTKVVTTTAIGKDSIGLIQTNDGFKVNGDSGNGGDQYVFEDDVDKAIANRKLAGTPTTKP